MTEQTTLQDNRRTFLKKFSLMGGIAAAGTLPATAAVHWLRTTAPPGSGEHLSLDPDPFGYDFLPLKEIRISADIPGTLMIFDGKNRLYYQDRIKGTIPFRPGGNLGHQLVILLDQQDVPADFATFQVDCHTAVWDSSGRYRKLLDNLYYTMTNEWERECSVVRYNGKYYHLFVSWLRDHVHTMKGMKYFYPELKSGIDLYADSQREDGMIWDNYNKRPPEGDYWEQRFGYGEFVRVVDEGRQEFRRIPVENDVEYLFIEGIYYTWKACGDDVWMKGMLDHALQALEYSTTDPFRWSEKYRLLKRGYTIDTWDFQNDEDAEISAGPDHFADPMVIRLPYTRFGIMFGDNTGMYAGCNYLAEMLDHAGRKEEAEKVIKTGKGIKERLDALAWNGEYYRHHIPEDQNLSRNLGVDESKQVSLSNAYSLNRMMEQERAAAIIRTYLGIREKMPRTSPGEWYTIFPPFGKGYGGHNTRWSYMNGGVTSIVAGELAHGAFEHGFESYGADILSRLLDLSEKTGGFLHCTYRGAVEPARARSFKTLSLEEIANTDFKGDTVPGVAGWTGEGENDLHEFPAGPQVFDEIPFEIIDPVQNDRRACLGLSGDPGYAREAALPVGTQASSIYLLHTTGVSYYAGSVSLVYEDGSRHIDHMGPGKVSNWWYPTAPQDRKQTPSMRVAWRGKNKFSRNVGVCLYGLNNPHPQKKIASLHFQSAGNSTKWMVLGVTLSGQQVYFMPDRISAGIPDNWGAAAVVYALVEGLCGVKDRGVAFNRVEISPRWSVAGEREASVTIKYPASDGYVTYKYSQQGDTLELLHTGNQEHTDVRLLIPGGVRPSGVLLNGEPREYTLEKVENSSYLVLKGITSNVNHIRVNL